jgi:uncharacterized protein (TIRG00374 family)
MSALDIPRPEDATAKVAPGPLRRAISFALKALVTAGAFWLLLTHEVRQPDGTHASALRTILAYLPRIDARTFWTFVALAALVKSVGILSSMARWHLLLRAQGIGFPFLHIAGSFLIGRFIGTFLPSTIGLDGYKLYDAARFSGRTVEAAAATAIEKALGILGILLSFLVAFPLGARLFGARAPQVAAVTVPLSAAVLATFLLLMTRPGLLERAIGAIPLPRRGFERIRGFIGRTSAAAAAFRHRGGILAAALGLSFAVHFTTAVMYWFTALAVGARGADFWQVTLASTVQILATVLSPFTIAGEGVREIVQTLLLAKKIGVSESILSAALGFWAAEALTLVGGIVWWVRGRNYRPKVVIVPEVPRPEDHPGAGAG